eukprot:SAG22_NODE_2054_length_3070_cov_1.685291_4_plen_157_part_00
MCFPAFPCGPTALTGLPQPVPGAGTGAGAGDAADYCRIATGSYHYGLVPGEAGGGGGRTSAAVAAPRCLWTPAVATNLPDAPSRTCASRLPASAGGGVYLVHNPGEATVMLLKAVITAFPCVSLPFLAVPLLSQRTVAIRTVGLAVPEARPRQGEL